MEQRESPDDAFTARQLIPALHLLLVRASLSNVSMDTELSGRYIQCQVARAHLCQEGHSGLKCIITDTSARENI